MNFFKSEFLQLVSNYTTDVETQKLCWNEIEMAYSGKKRFYHNLNHLDFILDKLQPLKNQFKEWRIIVFAIAYHDFVYDVLKSDNEEKSASYAAEKLKKLGVQAERIENCKELILATKKHLPSDNEVNLFTDADLSILGSETDVYQMYTDNIRREYSIFPSLVYNHGRKKVVEHFLEMERIFKSDEFYEKFEMLARDNMEGELLSLK